jgi:hypothetical protein
VELECVFEGVPPPTVDWLMNGVSVNETIVREFHSTGGVARLQIVSAGMVNNADYACVASNAAGMVQSVLTVNRIMGKSVEVFYVVKGHLSAVSSPITGVKIALTDLKKTGPSLRCG